MKFYYNIDGENFGPVTREELDSLATEGKIDTKTYVVAVPEKRWEKYGELAPVEAEVEEKLRVTEGSFVASDEESVVVRFNQSISDGLRRALKLPSFMSTEPAAMLRQLSKWSGVSSLAIWLSYLLLSLGIYSGSSTDIAMVVGVAFVLGFVVQHISYLLSRVTNVFIASTRVRLSSMMLPRVMGFLSLVSVLGGIIQLCLSETLASALIVVCWLPISVAMAYLCYQADKMMVKIESESLTLTGEFVNSLRFIVRAFLTTLYLMTPIVAPLGAVASLVAARMNDGSYEYLFQLGTLSVMALALIHVTLIVWVINGVASWLFDMMESLMSGAADK